MGGGELRVGRDRLRGRLAGREEAQSQGIPDTSIAALAAHPNVTKLIQRELDKANAKYGHAEQVKKFFILDHDLSQETGELTPTLKIKRKVINEKYAERFDALYS